MEEAASYFWAMVASGEVRVSRTEAMAWRRRALVSMGAWAVWASWREACRAWISWVSCAERFL